MKIGCGEWGFRELPLEEHFRLARKIGFRTLEFGIGGGQTGRLPATFGPDVARAFRELAREYRIATPGCCLENDFTLPDEQRHRAMLREVLEQIPLAALCGARQVRLFAGFTPAAEMTEPLWGQLLAALRAAEDCAAAHGLQIVIETHGRITHRDGVALHEHTVSTEPAALARLLREMPPRIGFNWDPGNLKAVAPADRLCALPLLKERIAYCHLKDWRREGDGWVACAIGDDDLDYEPLLRRAGFEGVYLIEYEPTHDPEDGIRRSLAYLRRLGFALEFA